MVNAHGAAADRMIDGHLMNTWVCDDGSVTTYHMLHETHPTYDADRMDLIWVSTKTGLGWGNFETTDKAGR